MKSWHFSKNSGNNTAYVLRSLFLVAVVEAVVVAVAVVVEAAAAATPSMGFELLSEARRNLSVKSLMYCFMLSARFGDCRDWIRAK